MQRCEKSGYLDTVQNERVAPCEAAGVASPSSKFLVSGFSAARAAKRDTENIPHYDESSVDLDEGSWRSTIDEHDRSAERPNSFKGSFLYGATGFETIASGILQHRQSQSLSTPSHPVILASLALDLDLSRCPARPQHVTQQVSLASALLSPANLLTRSSIGKRNTSRPVFTAHERSLAKSAWSSSSARLHRESFLPFGSCNLCLEIARDPVSCQRGDIFCRECALANLVAQKKELKRAEKAKKREELERESLRASEADEEQQRAVRDFEKTQAGLEAQVRLLNGKSSQTTARRIEAAPKASEETEEASSSTALVVGNKRKFALDNDELDRIAQEDRSKARKAIDDEKVCRHDNYGQTRRR